MNMESLLILFRFRYRFQQSISSPQAPIYWLWWCFIVYFFKLFIKRGKFVRGAKLSTTQIYNTQSSVKTEEKCLRIEARYNVDQQVVKSYFQPKLKQQNQSISA